MLRDTIVNTQQFSQNSDGILLFFDQSRTKWISTSRQIIEFGINHKNISTDRWLMTAGGVYTTSTGYKVPRNGTIMSTSIQSTANATCSFLVKRNNNVTTLHTLSLTAQTGKSDDNLDINVNENDWLQVLLSINTGVISYPVLLIEIGWR
jgi:hypothetical protein